MRSVVAAFALGFLVVTTHANAQTQAVADHRRAFLGAGVGAESDGTWPKTSVGGIAIASAGLDISKHIGIRVAFDMPAVSSTESQGTFGSFRIRTTEEHRSICWSVLIDGHRQLTDRVRFGVVGGVTIVRRPSVYRISREQLGAGDTVVGRLDTTTAYVFTWRGLTAGAEVPIALTRQLQVVPGTTVTWFPLVEYGRSTIARGGIELRWRF